MGQWLSSFCEEEEQKKTYKVFLTGTWRNKNKNDVETLKTKMQFILDERKSPFTIKFEVIDQETEGKGQALSAMNILKKNGLLTSNSLYNTRDGTFAITKGYVGMQSIFYIPPENMGNNLIIVVGAGRNSTQFTVINLNFENVVKVFKTSGFPKNGEPDMDAIKKTAKECVDWCGNNVRLIVGIDSIFHLLKNKEGSKVIKDNAELPTSIDKITTRGSDFLDLQFLVQHYTWKPMIVFRNVITTDGIMRKPTFITGKDTAIDGGSGKWALVDPDTGNQIESFELPDEFTGDEEKLEKIVNDCYEMVVKHDDSFDELMSTTNEE